MHCHAGRLFLTASTAVTCVLAPATALTAGPANWLHPSSLGIIDAPDAAGPAAQEVFGTVEPDPSAESRLDNWLTFSANLDGGYRNTRFFKSGYNSTFFQWDSRLELWLPPSKSDFSWGPYLRLAGITSSRTPVWENVWIARPGFGFQVYPFSLKMFDDKLIGKLLAPTRLFYEYNCMHYWGGQKWWRPDRQIRAGAEYWKDMNVSDTGERWWAEIWAGATWQSVDEWGKNFETTCLAASGRLGVRIPNAGVLSMFTPYLALESSLTDNYDHYWENRMLFGAGIRFAPPLPDSWKWLTRFVIFAEYLDVAAYYRNSASSSTPDYDFRIGVNINIGEWYKDVGNDKSKNGS